MGNTADAIAERFEMNINMKSFFENLKKTDVSKEEEEETKKLLRLEKEVIELEKKNEELKLKMKELEERLIKISIT